MATNCFALGQSWGTLYRRNSRPTPQSSNSYRSLVTAWRRCVVTPSVRLSVRAANASTNSPLTALECAQQLTAWRAEHSKETAPVLIDPLASQLLEGEGAAITLPQESYRNFIMATAFIDQQLLQCADYMNMDVQDAYQQVVLVGPGLDTRPFRLLWPHGTGMFEVAPRDSHIFAAGRVKKVGASVAPRCALWRVPFDVQADRDLGVALQSAGYNPTKLSLWSLQGLVELGLGRSEFGQLLSEISMVAASGSLVFGHLPRMTHKEVMDLLADVGLYGSPLPFGQPDTVSKDWDLACAPSPDQPQEWLFVAKQQARSLAEWDIFHAAIDAADGADEDEHLFFS